MNWKWIQEEVFNNTPMVVAEPIYFYYDKSKNVYVVHKIGSPTVIREVEDYATAWEYAQKHLELLEQFHRKPLLENKCNVDDDIRKSAKEFVEMVPLLMFQTLNKHLNERGLCIKIDAIPQNVTTEG